jgi:hypothetical protein
MNAVMAVLFAFAVAVQYNDPDPWRWSAIYGAACVVSVLAARTGRPPRALAAGVGAVALLWMVYWAVSSAVPANSFARMFDSWEMHSEPVEEAREEIGLLIVAAWMAVVAWAPARKVARTDD